MRHPLVFIVIGMSALGHAVAGDVHRPFRAHHAGEHPRQRDAAHVRVDRGVHHLGRQRSLRVRDEGARVAAVLIGELRQRVLQRRRKAALDAVEHLADADPGYRAHRKHGVQAALGHPFFQVGDQRGLVDRLAVEVPVHQRLVFALGDDGFDELAPRLVDLLAQLLVGRDGAPELVDLLGEQADQPEELAVRVEMRQVQRQHSRAERVLAAQQRGVEVRAGLVQPGDEHRTGHADRGALLPDRAGRGVDAFGGRQHEQRGVRGTQPGAQFTDEVRVAGRVDQVDLDVLVLHRCDGQSDGPLLLDRGGLVVAHRGALGDGARSGDRRGGGQHRLGDRGLAGGRRADQHDVADLGGF